VCFFLREIAGVPDQVRAELNAFFTLAFHEGFVGAMRVTLWLPIAVMGCAAQSVLLVRQRRSTAPVTEESEVTPAAT
jgi:hypothetical protein